MMARRVVAASIATLAAVTTWAIVRTVDAVEAALERAVVELSRR